MLEYSSTHAGILQYRRRNTPVRMLRTQPVRACFFAPLGIFNVLWRENFWEDRISFVFLQAMKRLYIIFVGLLWVAAAAAQELNAKININHSQVQGTDKSVFENLQQTLEQVIFDNLLTSNMV